MLTELTDCRPRCQSTVDQVFMEMLCVDQDVHDVLIEGQLRVSIDTQLGIRLEFNWNTRSSESGLHPCSLEL